MLGNCVILWLTDIRLRGLDEALGGPGAPEWPHRGAQGLNCGREHGDPDLRSASVKTQTWSTILMSTYPFKYGKDNLDNLDDGPENPDIEDGEQGEDGGPDHWQGEHEDSGDESVEPELGLTEQDERQPPQGIEPVRRAGLG